MQCPSCGKANLTRDTRDIPHTHKGQSTVIPSVTADFCPACPEFVLSGRDVHRVSQQMVGFNIRVNQALEVMSKWNLNPPNNHLVARIQLCPGRDQIIVYEHGTRIKNVRINSAEGIYEIVCVSTEPAGWEVSKNALSCPKHEVRELWILKPAGWIGEIVLDR